MVRCLHHSSSLSFKVHFFPLCGVGQFISLMAVLHAVLSVGSMWVILDALQCVIMCVIQCVIMHNLKIFSIILCAAKNKIPLLLLEKLDYL